MVGAVLVAGQGVLLAVIGHETDDLGVKPRREVLTRRFPETWSPPFDGPMRSPALRTHSNFQAISRLNSSIGDANGAICIEWNDPFRSRRFPPPPQTLHWLKSKALRSTWSPPSKGPLASIRCLV